MNEIDEKGALILASSIKNHPSLNALIIRCKVIMYSKQKVNRIGKKAGAAFYDCLEDENRVLRFVEVDEDFTPEKYIDDDTIKYRRANENNHRSELFCTKCNELKSIEK